MNPDLFRHKRLVDRKNREQVVKRNAEQRARELENLRMNAKELSLWPMFWVAMILVVVGLLVAPR